MLSDRTYMRSNYHRPGTSVLTWVLCAMGAAFLLQFMLGLMGNNSIENLFALQQHSLVTGKIWTLFSYALLHGNNILYLLVNGLGLFLIGRELLPVLGSNRFSALLAGAVLLGAAAWLGAHALRPDDSTLMGSSAATIALFITFACIFPEKEITFLVFFILPVRAKPKAIAWVIVGLELAGLAFSELGGKFDTGINHSAHLGGILAGWLYFRYFHARNGWDRAPGPVLELPAWLKRKKSEKSTSSYKVNITPHADLKTEVDRILDKINSSGFGALTDEEKRLLDEAKDLLSRH